MYLEPLHERRARVLVLPSAYSEAFAQYLSDIVDADVDARYFVFAFWTKARWGRDVRELSRMIQKACQFASCDMFPSLNKSSLNRIPRHFCLAAIVLPAQRPDGVFHVHGFLRVPLAALTFGVTQVSVQTNSRRVRIEAPRAVERFVSYLREFAGGSPTSLHINHEPT